MSLNDRISEIILYSGLTSSEFADAIEVQRSSISHITSGRNKPSLEFITKIKNRFPEIQWDWLITGNGEMIKNEENTGEAAMEVEKTRANTLPDLFSLIDDENFGFTEHEDRIQKEKPRESNISEPTQAQQKISDSQAIEQSLAFQFSQNPENQRNSIKRIVIFFENGTFENYEV